MMLNRRLEDDQDLLVDNAMEDFQRSMEHASLSLADDHEFDSEGKLVDSQHESFSDIARRSKDRGFRRGKIPSVTLTLEHISVAIPATTKKSWFGKKIKEIPSRQILSNVTGVARPGTVTALIGSSGSGKSVLMNVITRRNLGNLKVTGNVRVNGHAMRSDIMNIASYCQQHDLFVGAMKVQEHLWFNAQLRLPETLSKEEKLSRIEETLKELGLSHRADTIIGIPGKLKTLSGGERKRLSFASELLTNPSLMLCDEPTTGLDSFMAQNVIGCLRTMATNGRTVLCSIHQPASQVYIMFDQLLMLADGRTAYMGPIADAARFFNRCGLTCPMNYNPADFFIHSLALTPGREDMHAKVVETICSNYEKSEHLEDIHLEIDRIQFEAEEGHYSVDLGSKRNAASWTTQSKALLGRCVKNLRRESGALRATLIQFIVGAILFDLLYWHQTYNQAGVQNINGALFAIVNQCCFCTMASVYMILPRELMIFQREMQNGMYNEFTYYLSHVLTELPLFLFINIIFGVLTYWPVGFYPMVSSFMVYMADIMAITTYSVAFGHLVAVIAPNFNGGLALLTLSRNIMTLFGGIFISIRTLPVLILPMAYLTGVLYSMETFAVNQWKDVDHIACRATSMNSTTPMRCLKNGEQVLHSLGFQEREGLDFSVMILLSFATELLAFYILRRKAKKF